MAADHSVSLGMPNLAYEPTTKADTQPGIQPALDSKICASKTCLHDATFARLLAEDFLSL